MDSLQEFRWEDCYEEYENNNYGYVKGREDFVAKLKGDVCEATFSYFPELKLKKGALKPLIEKLVEDQCAHTLYENLFDTILDFYDHKEFNWKEQKWSYKQIETEEEMQKEAEEMLEVSKLNLKDIERIRTSMINSSKNQNHFNYYEQILHKAILRCVTNIFQEIPELSSTIIRYINYKTHDDSYLLLDCLFKIFTDQLVSPYNESIIQKEGAS